MNPLTLRNQLIVEGVDGIRETYPEGSPEYKGGLRGFEICRTLLVPDEFVRVLSARYAAESQMIGSPDADAFWEHRYATLQVEHVWKQLQVLYAFFDPMGPEGDFDVTAQVEEEKRSWIQRSPS